VSSVTTVTQIIPANDSSVVTEFNTVVMRDVPTGNVMGMILLLVFIGLALMTFLDVSAERKSHREGTAD